MEQCSHADHREDGEAVAKRLTTFKAISRDLTIESVETGRSDHRRRFWLLVALTCLTLEVLQAVEDLKICLGKLEHS